MKRWMTHSFIALYLTAISWGIVSHSVEYGAYSHPAMYYVVWDMFCGWSGYSGRLQIIGEGESGKYYELAPGPWGEFVPFGSAARRHYDTMGTRAAKFARNALAHSQHEPIIKIYTVEESWAKKYNLPDALWAKHFDGPREKNIYYNVLHIHDGNGDHIKSNSNWLSRQQAFSVTNNPRLAEDTRKGKPMYAYRFREHARGTYRPGTVFDPSASRQAGSRLGGN